MAALNAPDCSALGLNMNNANIMGRRMFRPHSAPVAMQAGGMAQRLPPEAMMPPAMPPGPPPEAMMPPAAMPPPTEEEGVATLMTEQGIDPAMMEQMLASASENFGNLDTAEDFEQAMNAIRGDQASVTERRGELAELVGPEDANRTPESVLTLVQPVMMLAEVDQGIGGLAQGEMTEPVTGDMAGGIMSTVDMGGAPEAPAPVNFNQGGAVQRFAPENEDRVVGSDRIRNLFTEQQQLYRDLITPTLTAEDLAENKRLTEAQILFDLANAGLQLAQPGPPGENFLGAVTRAGTDSQFFDKFGARTAEQRKLERASRAEKQAVDLAALQSAQDVYSTERGYDAALAKIMAQFAQDPVDKLYDVLDAEGNVIEERVPVSNAKYSQIQKAGGSVVPYTTEKFGSTSQTNQIKALTKFLPSYADGTISDENALTVEFILSDLYGPKLTLEGREFYPAIPTQVNEALQSRINMGLSAPEKLTLGMEPQSIEEQVAETRTEEEQVAETMTEEDQETVDQLEFESPEFYASLLNEQGTQPNYDSPNWFRFESQRFDPEIGKAYEKSFGMGAIGLRISNWAGRNLREFGIGKGVSKKGQQLIEADADFEALRNDLSRFAKEQGGLGGDERVLKSDQDYINDELLKITPGLFNRADENAVAVISNVKKKIGTYWANEMKKLSKMGDPQKYSAKQVSDARDRIGKAQLLLVDTILFEKALRDHLASYKRGDLLRETGETFDIKKDVLKRAKFGGGG